MSQDEVTGSCLCGEVRYAIDGNLGIFQYCHCSRCRKFTGSAFAASMIIRPGQFRWTAGESLVGRYEVPEAKHYATQFCTRCGSSLPWLAKSGRAMIIPAGTLDADPGLRPSQNLYCASDAVWYTEPGSLPKFDELPGRGGN